MTLIEVRTSQDIVGRCDAKCYEAEHSDCTCICDGANHGGGLQQAMQNTRECAERWIDEWEKEHPGQTGCVVNAIRQQALF